MKALVFLFCLGLLQAVSADAFDDAKVAIQRGDYAAAFILLRPFAERGSRCAVGIAVISCLQPAVFSDGISAEASQIQIVDDAGE